MRALAIIVNVFFPGVGSFFVGKITEGIIQIVLYIIGIMLIVTVAGAIIGAPLCFGVWIWGLVTAANAPQEPVQVTIIHQQEQPGRREVPPAPHA